MSMTPSCPIARRAALQRLFALVATQAASLPLLAACGGGGAGNDPIGISLPPAPVPTLPPAAPVPSPPTAVDPLVRLKAALAVSPLSVSGTSVTVTQGAAQSADSSFGSSALVYPPLPQSSGASLATASQVWGNRRDLWTQQTGAVIAGRTVVPVSRDHAAATLGSQGLCGLHFHFDGQAFEVLIAGSNVSVTLIANGQYMTSQVITTAVAGGVAGAALANPNTSVKFDFGSSATRAISLYARSSQGPCAIMVAAGGNVTAWDRSAEASFAAISDSYGGASSAAWGVGGLFYEAAVQLGIANIDLDAIGGTGYAPNASNSDTQLVGNAFDARLPTSVDGLPDLFVTAGSLNDNNSRAAAPYTTAADALAGFDAAVTSYFDDLRASLPDAVIAAIGPWQPPGNIPPSAAETAKAATIASALQAAGGRWVFIDNMNGGWKNSAGASESAAASTGPWQTVANSATYLYPEASGVLIHPNAAGCLYLATQLATNLRAAIAAL